MLKEFKAFVLRGNQNLKAKPAEAPATRECPHCLSTVPIKATRCAHCTSTIEVPSS